MRMGPALSVNPTAPLHCTHYLPVLLSTAPVLLSTARLQLSTVLAVHDIVLLRRAAPTSTGRTVPLLFTLLPLRSIHRPVPVGMVLIAVRLLTPVAVPIRTIRITEALGTEVVQETEATGMAKTPPLPLLLVAEKSPCGERLTISKRIIQISSTCYSLLSKAFRTSTKPKISATTS